VTQTPPFTGRDTKVAVPAGVAASVSSPPAAPTDASTPSRAYSVRQINPALLGILPFVLVVGVFLVLPVVVNLWTSFHNNAGEWSFESFIRLGEAQYVSAFVNTAALATTTALIGGLGGLILAWALATLRRPAWLRDVVLSFSGVASQFGGVPLAFAFVAALGTQGVVTNAVRDTFGIDLSELLPLSDFAGLVVVYLYFQIPLMAILMLPAVSGLRREWRESATSLGAGPVRFLLQIVMPIISPAVGGAVLVLFANAFSAFATAYALSGGGANLVPILIGFFVSGNVVVDESFGATLATGMMAVVAVSMLARWVLMRRVTRWLR